MQGGFAKVSDLGGQNTFSCKKNPVFGSKSPFWVHNSLFRSKKVIWSDFWVKKVILSHFKSFLANFWPISWHFTKPPCKQTNLSNCTIRCTSKLCVGSAISWCRVLTTSVARVVNVLSFRFSGQFLKRHFCLVEIHRICGRRNRICLGGTVWLLWQRCCPCLHVRRFQKLCEKFAKISKKCWKNRKKSQKIAKKFLK